MGKQKQKLIINYLHEIQNKYGFIPKQELIKLSKKVNKSTAELYETASSYAYFSFEKKPKKLIKMCQSPVCHMKGSENLLAYVEKLLKIKVGEKNAKIDLEATQCLGLCDEAPVMAINEKLYTKLTKDKIKRTLRNEKII